MSTELKIKMEEDKAISKNSGKFGFFSPKNNRKTRKSNRAENLAVEENISKIVEMNEKRPYDPVPWKNVPSGYKLIYTIKVQVGDTLIHDPFDKEETNEVFEMKMNGRIWEMPSRTLEDINNYLQRRERVPFEPDQRKIVLRSYRHVQEKFTSSEYADKHVSFYDNFMERKYFGKMSNSTGPGRTRIDRTLWMKSPEHYRLNDTLNSVIEMAFDPVNQHLIVCGGGETGLGVDHNDDSKGDLLCCYDLKRGCCVRMSGEHHSCVTDIKFSPGEHDKRLVSCGDDGKINVWQFDRYNSKDNEYYTNQPPSYRSNNYYRKLDKTNNGYYISQKLNQQEPEEEDVLFSGEYKRRVTGLPGTENHCFPIYEIVFGKSHAVRFLWIEFGRGDERVYVSDRKGFINEIRYLDNSVYENPVKRRTFSRMQIFKNRNEGESDDFIKVDEIILSPTRKTCMYCFNECSGDWHKSRAAKGEVRHRGNLALFDMNSARHIKNFSVFFGKLPDTTHRKGMILETMDVGSIHGQDCLVMGHHNQGEAFIIQGVRRNNTQGFAKVGKPGVTGRKMDRLLAKTGVVKVKFDSRSQTQTIWYSKNSEIFGFDIRKLEKPLYLWTPSLSKKVVTEFAVEKDLLCVATGSDLHMYDYKNSKFVSQLNPEGNNAIFSNLKFSNGPPKMLLCSTDDLNSVNVFRERNGTIRWKFPVYDNFQ